MKHKFFNSKGSKQIECSKHVKVLLLSCILVLVTACSEKTPLTWEDVGKLRIQSAIDGVGFDVPLNYHYGEKAKNIHNGAAISKRIKEGKTRRTVDYIKIYALLPDLEPVTQENLPAFTEPGWGRKIIASITHPRSFEYYFRHTVPKRLDRLPDSPEMPGMLRYQDNITKDDIYLSHDHAVPGLTRIRCKYARPGQSPSCDVETQYLHETNLNAGDKYPAPFYLQYSFSHTYLPQWREIDREVKALFDQFAESTAVQQ